jgi:hypothetical protein
MVQRIASPQSTTKRAVCPYVVRDPANPTRESRDRVPSNPGRGPTHSHLDPSPGTACFTPDQVRGHERARVSLSCVDLVRSTSLRAASWDAYSNAPQMP